MCWINWIISKSNISKQDLEKMNQVIKHRWPDDSWIFIDKNIWLGQVRLSIIDLSDAWHQPMFYNKNLWASSENFNKKNIENSEIAIIFNGEIYNYQELKQELKQKWYNFSTHTDTEVILASYLEYWKDCVKKFNWMWAFAIYDKRKNIIFASRDRMWKKPFYYFWDKKQFIFSSEIKWILENDVERILNLDELPSYLLFHYTPGTNTLFKNIYKLPASHNLIFDLENFDFKIEKYWDIENDEIKYKNFEKAEKKLDELLNDSIKLRTQTSDVPVGTFLSWWLDSSLVSSLFKKYYSGKEFHTFNVVWEDEIPNEGEFAEIVSKHIWSKHHKFKVTWKDVLTELEKLQYHYDDPIAEAGYIPNYFVAKYAKNYVKVVLTGDGADEVFAGYSYYNFWQKFWKLWQIPGVKMVSKILASILPASKYQKWFEFLSNASWKNYDKFIWFTISQFSNKELQILLTNKFEKNKNYLTQIRTTIKNCNSFLNQLLYTDQKVLLAECYNIKPDKALMWNSLEWRAPMQDYRLVEFAYQIPDDFKIKNWKEKYILTEVWKKYLPQEIFTRKKQGFGVPIYEWINKDLKEIVFETLNNSVLVKNWYFNKKQIDFYLKNVDKKYFSTRIWNLFSLELFIKVYKLKIK